MFDIHQSESSMPEFIELIRRGRGSCGIIGTDLNNRFGNFQKAGHCHFDIPRFQQLHQLFGKISGQADDDSGNHV